MVLNIAKCKILKCQKEIKHEIIAIMAITNTPPCCRYEVTFVLYLVVTAQCSGCRRRRNHHQRCFYMTSLHFNDDEA